MGEDDIGESISQKMECVEGEIFQYLYPNANCSDEPFKTNFDIHGYCDGIVCEEYAQVKTYLNESCSTKDGWFVLPMLMFDCIEYDFGEGKGQAFKFLCDMSEGTVNLGIFNRKDCRDARYTSYEIYKNQTCIDGEYAQLLYCPEDHNRGIRLSVTNLGSIVFVAIMSLSLF